MEETTEVMLYRIIQEACNNIVKHANATEVLIQTSKIHDDLMVVVEDNGLGFSENVDEVNGGIGLKSIESRVKFLEGQVDIASTEKGTCITLQIPVE